MDIKYEAAKKYSGGSAVRKDSSITQRYNLFSGVEGNIYNQNSGPFGVYLKYNHLRFNTNRDGTDYAPADSALSWDAHFSLYLAQLKDLIFTFDKYEREDVAGYSKGGGAFMDSIKTSDYSKRSATLAFGNNGGIRYYASYFEEHIFQRKNERVERNIMLSKGVNSIIVDDWQIPAMLSTDLMNIRTMRIGQIGIKNYTASAKAGISKARLHRQWYRLSNWLQVSSMFAYSDIYRNQEWQQADRSFDFALTGSRAAWSFGMFPSFVNIQQLSGITKSSSIPVAASYSMQRTEYSWSGNHMKSHSEINSSTSDTSSIEESFRIYHSATAKLSYDSSYMFGKATLPDGERKNHRLRLIADLRDTDRFAVRGSYHISKSDYENNTDPNSSNSDISHLASLIGILNLQDLSLQLTQTAQRAESESNSGKTESSADSTALSATGKLSDATTASASAGRNASSTSAGDKSRTTNWSTSLTSKADISSKMVLNWGASYKEENTKDTQHSNKDSQSTNGNASLNYNISSNLSSTTKTEKSVSSTNEEKYTREMLNETINYTYYTNGFTVKRPYFVSEAGVTFLTEQSSETTSYKLSAQLYPRQNVSYTAAYLLNKHGGGDKSESINLSFEYKFPLSTFEGKYWRKNIDNANGNIGKDYLQIHFNRKF